AHRGPLQPRTPEKTFHTRIEGQFRRIVRHGDNPTAYWWEITDKTGVRYFYGGDPTSNGPISDCTLSDVDPNGNIFKLAVREMRDLHGNAIKFEYERVVHPSIGLVAGQSQPQQVHHRVLSWIRPPTRDARAAAGQGIQLYPKRINYTQS